MLRSPTLWNQNIAALEEIEIQTTPLINIQTKAFFASSSLPKARQFMNVRIESNNDENTKLQRPIAFGFHNFVPCMTCSTGGQYFMVSRGCLRRRSTFAIFAPGRT